jgi:hypothetical protein
MIRGILEAGALLAILPLLAASAGAGAADRSPDPLFADDALLDITIDAPFSTLMEVRPDQAQLNGSLSYTEPDGRSLRLSVKLRTRGNFRRSRENCNFAPIRLNFKKGEVRDTLFHGQDKLKLVTHCQSFEKGYEQNLLREYLAYALFRELTDISYGVRLLRVTYFDTEKNSSLTRFGFLIEGDKDVAKRNGLQRIETRYLAETDHDRRRQNLVHVFEYMIGNTEYSLVNPEPEKHCCHNADILGVSADPPYLALPYDFDFSGLVNAPYAEPNPKYPIRSVRVRFYKGLCTNNDLLPETLQLFREKRGDVLKLIETLRGHSVASSRAARSARTYIQAFFRIIDDPDKVRERMIENCVVPDPPE